MAGNRNCNPVSGTDVELRAFGGRGLVRWSVSEGKDLLPRELTDNVGLIKITVHGHGLGYGPQRLQNVQRHEIARAQDHINSAKPINKPRRQLRDSSWDVCARNKCYLRDRQTPLSYCSSPLRPAPLVVADREHSVSPTCGLARVKHVPWRTSFPELPKRPNI